MTKAIVKCPDRFVETEIDDEVVLMDLESADFFSLTGPAFDVWQLVDGTRDKAAIVSTLAAEYGETPEAIAPDVDAFLAEMVGAGFLKRD
jgi:hypothetical protein